VRLFQEKICFAFDEIYHILHSFYLVAASKKDKKVTDLVIIAKAIRDLKQVSPPQSLLPNLLKVIEEYDTAKAQSIDVRTERNIYVKGE
jgi:hypothetical protein